MGTRNLTIVKLNRKIKVAQYGQWDGYPAGQGQTIAAFLSSIRSEEDFESFKNKVSKLRFVGKEEYKKRLEAAGLWTDSNFITLEHSDKINKLFPFTNRDHGAGILAMIASGKVCELLDQRQFKKDKLFCEYFYEIDLDKKEVLVSNQEKEKVLTFKEFIESEAMEKLESFFSDDEEESKNAF